MTVHFYITRDRIDGVLSWHVDVWNAKPIRKVEGKHVLWVKDDSLTETLISLHGTYSIERLIMFGYPVPQTDSECLEHDWSAPDDANDAVDGTDQ